MNDCVSLHRLHNWYFSSINLFPPAGAQHSPDIFLSPDLLLVMIVVSVAVIVAIVVVVVVMVIVIVVSLVVFPFPFIAFPDSCSPTLNCLLDQCNIPYVQDSVASQFSIAKLDDFQSLKVLSMKIGAGSRWRISIKTDTCILKNDVSIDSFRKPPKNWISLNKQPATTTGNGGKKTGGEERKMERYCWFLKESKETSLLQSLRPCMRQSTWPVNWL
ncbi:hypothetical protein Tco_1058526 [Tanacetum coccineum]|uniref:Uncharacterized protein n=1 Tax=Tanacetum coccineum TaxID=301880 RepID=A0ABQ5H9A8_9ASTR